MKNTWLDTSLQMTIMKDLLEKGCSNIWVEGISLWICTDKFMEQFGKVVPKGKEDGVQEDISK